MFQGAYIIHFLQTVNLSLLVWFVSLHTCLTAFCESAPHTSPRTETLQRGKRSITQLDVWAAASTAQHRVAGGSQTTGRAIASLQNAESEGAVSLAQISHTNRLHCGGVARLLRDWYACTPLPHTHTTPAIIINSSHRQ